MSCSPLRLFLLALLAFILVLASLDIGSSGYTLPQLLSGQGPRVILEIRVARTLAALSAGVVLGVAGLLLQYSLRNPLADPFLLGISPAAVLAVVLLALSAPSILGFYAASALAAVAGGLGGLALVLLLSRFAVDAVTTILAGIAVSTTLSGAAYALDYLASEKLGWPPSHALFGGFAGILPSTAPLLAATAIAALAAGLALAPRLEALLYGDDAAVLSGVEPRVARLAALLAAGVTVALITGYVGVIGFVGLIAPNAARRLLSCVEGRSVAVASALLGASVTLAADIASRLAGLYTSLGEIPAGALIAVAGGAALSLLVARG